MQCENCGQRKATVHHRLVIDGQTQESHLCEICAQAQGQPGFMAQPNFPFPNLSIQQLLSGFLGQNPFGHTAPIPQKPRPAECKNCGMSYSEFAHNGMLGCAECYEQLEPHLTPLIKRIHGTTIHGGKAPKRTGGVLRKRRELVTLKQQLAQVISEERYEDAVRLRDRIRELESELQAAGSGEDVG